MKSYIYAVHDRQAKRIKIGYTTEPGVRIPAVGRACGALTLEVLWVQEGTRRNEKILHAKLQEDHLTGDWFEANKRVLRQVKRFNSLGQR